MNRPKEINRCLHDHGIWRFSMICSLVLLFFSACSSSKNGVTTAKAELKEHTFAQVDSLRMQEARPIAVFLHTDWCRFCENMKHTSLRDPEVVEALNERYYFVSFDGEQEEEVVFAEQTYRYQPTGRTTGTHELAMALGTQDGTLAYPSFVILDPELEIVFQYNAFLSATQLVKVLGN